MDHTRRRFVIQFLLLSTIHLAALVFVAAYVVSASVNLACSNFVWLKDFLDISFITDFLHKFPILIVELFKHFVSQGA